MDIELRAHGRAVRENVKRLSLSISRVWGYSNSEAPGTELTDLLAMAVVFSNTSWLFLPCLFANSSRRFANFNSYSPIARNFAVVRSPSTAFTEILPSDSVLIEDEVNSVNKILGCPICYNPIISSANAALSVNSTYGSNLQCTTCKKSYFGSETHLELTVASGAKNYGEAMPASTELFRFPLVSFLYERGWRQTFSVYGGFPGPDKEFELIKTYLKPVLGGNIVDASCASGLFSRRFAKSGLFHTVVALDYSENMLRQCYDFIKQEDNFPEEKIVLVRADISRLPFTSSSVDAVHAGAALHCWPSPSAGVAEISRVMRPGGVFVASTYILDGPFAFIPYLKAQRERVRQLSGSHIFLSERELEDLCTACGLVGFTSIRSGLFVMISATKPT